MPPQQNVYDRNKRKVDINLPNYDEKLLHYGFFLALAYNRVTLTHSEAYLANKSLREVTPIGTMGFSLGFLMNIRINDQLAFKFVPAVGFYNRNVRYTFDNPKYTAGVDSVVEEGVETTFIETHFLLKYKSVRRNNHRMYLIGGFKPAIRAGGRKGDNNEPHLVMGRYDFSIEYGAGFDLYFQFFKFSPELRFSHGIANVLTNDNSVYNQSLVSMFTHNVTLYFFFE